MEGNTDESNGIRFTWNILPSTRVDTARMIVPPGFHYTPRHKKIDESTLLGYDPLLCNQCKSVLNPFVQVNFQQKKWHCTFCRAINSFPAMYAEYLSETQLPAELMQEETTVEYRLSKKESNWPIFIFVIDTALEEEELMELKESIQQVLNNIPQECQVGIITYGNMCNVHEIGFGEYPTSYVFRGEKHYKTLEIQEQLGLVTVNRNLSTSNPNQKEDLTNQVKFSGVNRFVQPISDCQYAVTTLLDDLQPDAWGRNQGERPPRCGGLAMHVAISLLEATNQGEPCRIMLFLGGALTVGLGNIVSKPLTETIRGHNDFEKNNPNTKYYKPATEFYEILANRASKAEIIIDVFSCSLNQAGLYEVRKCLEKTGGLLVLTDSFSTLVFKDSLKKLFELDENGNLKMNFKAKLEIFSGNPVKFSGALGHLVSQNINGNNVSDIKVGESGTRNWMINGLDDNSTYTFILDMEHTTAGTALPKFVPIQILTSYVAGDRSRRLRVTTVNKRIFPEMKGQEHWDELGRNFDQEAAAVMVARTCVSKGFTEDSRDILKWIDKSLIRLIAKFASYKKEDPRSFKLSNQFNYFPQFMFYLRRSYFIQNFNASPDEMTFYKHHLMHENVLNSTVMIQPMLFSYSPEKPEATPVYLDLESMKNDHVLLLDAFFFVAVWHGDEVVKWRDAGFQNDPEYDNIKQMLENPQDYAQTIITERLPVPRFVSCDFGTGQERLLKCTVNPSNTSRNNVVEDGFVSDDVSLKVFMEFLVKLAVSS